MARQVSIFVFHRTRKMRLQEGKGPDGWHRAGVEARLVREVAESGFKSPLAC